MKKSMLGASASIALLAPCAFGALTITNGDFELDAVQTSNVTGWFDSVTANTANWWESTWAGPANSPNGTPVMGLSYMFAETNWAYQPIGTNSEGLTSILLQFDAGSFTDAGGSRDLGVTVSLYSSDGTFVPADNADVDGAAGVTFLDSFDWSALVAPGEMVTGITGSLDLSGAGPTDELYLRFENFAGATGEPWTAVDNISIVPEPAAALLAAFGAIGLLRRRR